MLPLKHRLRHERDIKTLFAKGKSVFGNGLGLKYKTNTFGVTRFAMVVGTKVSKRAVDRNLLKRRLRAIVEKELSQITEGYDVLFLTKKNLLDFSYDELEKQVHTLLKRAYLIKT